MANLEVLINDILNSSYVDSDGIIALCGYIERQSGELMSSRGYQQNSASLNQNFRIIALKLLARVFHEQTTGFSREYIEDDCLIQMQQKEQSQQQVLQSPPSSSSGNTSVTSKEFQFPTRAGGWLKELMLLSMRLQTHTVPGTRGNVADAKKGSSTFNTGINTGSSTGNSSSNIKITDSCIHYRDKYNLSLAAARLISILTWKDSLLMSVFQNSFESFDMPLTYFPLKAQHLFHKDNIFDFCLHQNQSMYSSLLKGRDSIIKKHHLRIGDVLYAKVPAFEYFIICMLRYSVSGGHSTGVADVSQEEEENNSAVHRLLTVGPAAWLSGCPYLVLVKKYLDYFVSSDGNYNMFESRNTPTSASKSITSASSTNSHSIGSASKGIIGNHGNSGDQTTANIHFLQQGGFIQLACEFWIENCSLIVNKNFDKMKGMIYAPHAHEHPAEVVINLLNSDCSDWNTPTLQCIYLLLLKVLSTSTASLSSGSSSSNSSGIVYKNSPVMSGKSSSSDMLRYLQQPLFDMLRTIFIRGISSMKSPAFRLAVEIWMLYLQPWKAASLSEGVSRKESDRIRYSDVWKDYVASNIDFYTTLFLCYTKASSLIEFTSKDDGGKNYFEAFNTIIAVISDVGLYSVVNELSSLAYSSDSSHTDRQLRLRELLQYNHELLLPDSIKAVKDYGFVQLNSNHRLKMLVRDVIKKNIYLIITKQQQNSRYDGLGLGSLFGAIASTTKASTGPSRQQVEELLKKLCNIVALNYDDELSIIKSSTITLPQSSDPSGYNASSMSTSRYTSSKDMTRNDYYSMLQKEDALDRPLHSDEVPFLARDLIILSKHLNKHYHLPMSGTTISYRELMSRITLTVSNPDCSIRNKLIQSCQILRESFRYNLRFVAKHYFLVSTLLFLSMMINRELYYLTLAIAGIISLFHYCFTGFRFNGSIACILCFAASSLFSMSVSGYVSGVLLSSNSIHLIVAIVIVFVALMSLER